MASGGECRVLRGIARSVGSEVALDGSACRNVGGCAGGEMNSGSHFDIERCAEVDGSCGGSGSGL